MKRAAVVPPEVIVVAVTASPSAATAVRRRGHSLKRSLSLNQPAATSISINNSSRSDGGGTSNGSAGATTSQTPPDGGADKAAALAGGEASACASSSLPSPSTETETTAVGVSATTPAAATTPMRAVSDPGSPPTPPPLVSSGSISNSGILRKADSECEMVLVPLAVAYLEQVKMDITVAKQSSDIRYVMTVHHSKLQLKWHNARSFDEYRKLQQRLLKLLHHGHFCSADCPWMYTFLKSYFPKKHIFNFSSACVVEARKAALERFFATAQSFLLNRVNHGCGFMTAAFANELVDFIYGDMLKLYPLDRLTNVQTTISGVIPGLPQRHARALAESSVASSCSDEELEGFSSATVAPDTICQICDASLYGEAFAGKDRANSSLTGCSFSSLESLELDIIATSLAASAGVVSVSPTSSSSTGSMNSQHSHSHHRRRNTHYVTTLKCGHQFHDECIVPKLNETLRCPTCGHLEVK